MINENESIASINEKEEMTTMQDLDDLVEIFREEANNEDLRSAKNRPKGQNSGAGVN